MAKGYKDLLLKEVLELFKKLPPNVRLRVYYDDMGKRKYTLNELGDKVDKLETRMDKIEAKLDQIADALFAFIKVANERFDRIEARLDYNGLMRLPKDSK